MRKRGRKKIAAVAQILNKFGKMKDNHREMEED